MSPKNLNDYIEILGNRIERVNQIYSKYDQFQKNGSLSPQSISELQRDLEIIGIELYRNLFDDEFKALYWDILKDNVKSVLIHSEDLRIPWELVRPSKDEAEDLFWGEKFELARYPKNLRMPRTIHVRKIVLISPPLSQDSSEVFHRSSAQEEFDLIRQAFSNVDFEEVNPPNKQAIEQLFQQSNSFSNLHYFGHCRFVQLDPDASCLILANGETLMAREVVGRLLGFASNGNQAFIFMNACASAGDNFNFSGVNGWIRVFVYDAKCSGFIGTCWEVSHFAACKFSAFFYNSVTNSSGLMTVARALKDARLDLRDLYPGDPSWLSYTIYGEPFAKFVLQ